MFNVLIAIALLSSITFSQVSISQINDDNLELIEKLNNQSSNLSRNANSPDLVQIETTGPVSNNDSNYFGYNYFIKNINFFDNVPTPRNFKLGPGDEIIISFWGETNLRENFIINKEGSIYYKNIGFINLANQTIDEAESTLKRELSQIYSTLNNEVNTTKMKVEVEKIKSINVYLTGQVNNPGVNIVHPFSDIFASIIQGGGIKNEGSLRMVELIRDGKTISYFDFYEFFIKGNNNFSEIRILEGDIIHVPVINKRVKISGPVYNPGFFELLDDESLSALVNFAGGTQANSSSRAILDEIIPISQRDHDDFAQSSSTIFLKDFDKTIPNNGSSVNLLYIRDQDTKVGLFGRVKAPGTYPYTSSLKEILDSAGGFNDPFFRKSILDDQIKIIRKNEKQTSSLEFIISYKESSTFKLEPGDEIFVYEDNNYDRRLLISIDGEVNAAGFYQIFPGTKISDVIRQAGGLTELANTYGGIIVEEEVLTIDINGNKVAQKSLVNRIDEDFVLSKNSYINILPKENVVKVIGNVYAPGLISFYKGKSVTKYIELAGGYKPDSLKKQVYVKRLNGEIDKVGILRGRGLKVNPGDTVFIPKDTNPSEFNLNSFVSDLTTTFANIVAILILIDNQNT